MEAMGGSPTPQELDAVMYELDSNGDSVVDFPEFLTKFLTATDEKELLSVFHQLAIQEGEGDDDRVLTLTAVERSFQYVGERLTDEDKKYLEIIFKGADKDGNGRLDIKEFTAYLEKMDDELFMGQAGALGNLLAAANTSGGAVAAAAKSLRRGGGSASQRRSAGEEGEPGGAAADGAGGSGAAGGGTDAEATGAGARLTNSQLLAMATRALSNRGAAGGFMFGGGGGLGDDMESVSSNQGGLRQSFLAKLTRGRRRNRRSSVNSSTIAALAGQLASMGVTGGGAAALRVGSVSSAAALAAASLLHPEASEGVRSVSSARTGMYSPFGGAPAPPPALPGGGATQFIVESSSVSALRLVSSTGQLPGFMFPEDVSHGPGPGVAATAPVALSRGGSFGDGSAAQEPGPQDGGQAAGVRAGPGPQHQRPGWAPGGAAAAANGGGGVGSQGAGGRTAPLQHQKQQQQSPHPYPHRSPSQQQVQPPVFGQMRSRSMPSTVAAAAAPPPMGLSAGLAPLAIPASMRDPDEPLSGSTSPFCATPGSAAAAFAAAAAAAGGGGAGSSASERGGWHAGYSGRSAGSGLRSPAPSWQKASVIQEAPEEGDSGYGGMGAAAALGPAFGLAGQRWDHHGGRTSAPTRFGRLASFPERLPLQADLAAGAGAVSAGGGVSDGRSSAGTIVRGGGSGGVAAALPLRLGSGGEGRLSHRIGDLMTAVFGRERSLGHGTAAAAARDPEADPRSGASESGARPSPSKAQLPSPRPPAAQAGSDGARTSAHGAAAAPAPAASSSWSFAAGARAAMGWLRRASSLGQNRAGGKGGGGTSGGGGGTSSGGAGTSSGGAGARDEAPGGQPPLLAPSPPAAAAVAAGSGRVPPWRLSVKVPGSDSLGRSKPTSPADIEASPEPSVGTSPLLSPGPSYLASPFTSPAAATARAAIGGGGLTSPPPALLTGSGSFAAAAAVAAAEGPPAPASPEAGPLAPGGVREAPPSDAPHGTGRPSASSPRAAHVAALQPPFRRPGSPQSRTSAPGASPWLVSPQQHQQPQHLSSSGLPQPEPVAEAPPAWPPPQPPRPAPAVPSVVSVSSRMGGAGGLNRSGSVGGSSRLAVSSARDSPPVVPRHMQRQQSLQLQQHSPAHHLSPLALQQHQPHRLSQQGLPQQPLYPHLSTALHPRSGLQSPHDPDQQQQQSHPLPHRLSHSGLPHGTPHFSHQQPPSPRAQPLPSQVQQPQQRAGDWGPYGPDNSRCHQPPPQLQLQQIRSGPESAASTAGGARSGGAPSSARVAAPASSAAFAASAGAQGSPWGVLHAAAHLRPHAAGPNASVCSRAEAVADGDAGASGGGPQPESGWHGGVQQPAHLGTSYCYPPSRSPQRPALGSALRREASEPVLGGPPSPWQDYGREQQQQQQQQQQPKPQEGLQRLQQQRQRQQHYELPQEEQNQQELWDVQPGPGQERKQESGAWAPDEPGGRGPGTGLHRSPNLSPVGECLATGAGPARHQASSVPSGPLLQQ